MRVKQISAIMKGGKNSLSIYRANILIFSGGTIDAQGQRASTIIGFTTNSEYRNFYGWIRAKKSCYLLVA